MDSRGEITKHPAETVAVAEIDYYGRCQWSFDLVF
jgi:hypothetical protein